MRRNFSSNAVALLLTVLMIASALTFMPINVANAAPRRMTFTSGDTVNFGSTVNMEFSSGIIMKFGTGIRMQVFDMNGDGVLAPCDWLQIFWPAGYIPPPCSWWEVLDKDGQPTGFEFHVDQAGLMEFHIDMMYPGPVQILPVPFWVEMKVDIVEPCRYYTVHWPAHWYPAECSWWEILDPETREPTGFEFHIDWTNESCEFHIDEVTPEPYVPPFLPVYEMIARRKVTEIKTCDWFHVETPQGFVPSPLTWWEVTIPHVGGPSGVEFHVDQTYPNGTFHVDQVLPMSPAPIPWGPTDLVPARQKVETIAQCSWFQSFDLAKTPTPGTWWKVTHPNVDDVEFRVDQSNQDGTFHVDYANPVATFNPPTFEVIAEKKITGIVACDWFKVISPTSWVPAPCTHWKIVWPTQWAGVKFHVDSSDGIDRFHVDSVDQMGPAPTPPPWNVTAEQYTPPESWYLKPAQDDYATSGMPDFDQHQDQWGPAQGIYTWCGPVATANSLWWLDSEYETIYNPNPVPPPMMSDFFPLVTSYNPGVWDDHDPQNVDPLVRNLAFLMDTDGQRTGLTHQGTNYIDMETGISQYLQQQGVNPLGDCDGDGKVEPDDITIINNAMGSIPGAPNWDMRADIVINNVIDLMDLSVAMTNLGSTGMFYEHTEDFADFYWIEEEIERCQDVELFLEFWQWTGTTWIELYDNPSLEAGHFVTCAGVNSTNLELLISDPYWDAYEAGAVQGRSPVPHLYPHPPMLHNDAQYVSHDEYVAQLWALPPPPGYAPRVWELTGYLQALGGYNQNWHAFIRAAVATSPLGVHDVAVTNVTNCKQGCKPKPTVGKGQTMHINVTVENQGDFTETFDVTVYATSLPPAIVVGTQTVTNLLQGEIRILTFLWDTTSVPYGNYSISATATPVPGETDTADNTYVDSSVLVTITGDVDGSFAVGILDVVKITSSYMAKIGQPAYNPNADINDSGQITILDVVLCTGHYGEHYP